MYETVKVVNGYEIYRMKGTHGFYYVNIREGKGWKEFHTFHTIKAAAQFCETLKKQTKRRPGAANPPDITERTGKGNDTERKDQGTHSDRKGERPQTAGVEEEGRGQSGMIVDWFGIKVRIPKGFAQDQDGTFIRHTGQEYAMCEYGRGSDSVIVLEPIYAHHLRTFVCEKIN